MSAAVVVEPRAVRFNPQTIVEAQFSLPYVVACALATGEVGLSAFSMDRLGDPLVRGLMERLEVTVREVEGGRTAGMVAPARVEIQLRDGTRLAGDGSPATCRADLAAGQAEGKFAGCMRVGGRAGGIEPTLALVRRLEDEPDAVSKLVRLLAEG